MSTARFLNQLNINDAVFENQRTIQSGTFDISGTISGPVISGITITFNGFTTLTSNQGQFRFLEVKGEGDLIPSYNRAIFSPVSIAITGPTNTANFTSSLFIQNYEVSSGSLFLLERDTPIIQSGNHYIYGNASLRGTAPNGLITSQDIPVSRPIRLFVNGVLLESTISNNDGTWEINNLNPNIYFDLQVVGTEEGEKDLFFPKVRASPNIL